MTVLRLTEAKQRRAVLQYIEENLITYGNEETQANACLALRYAHLRLRITMNEVGEISVREVNPA